MISRRSFLSCLAAVPVLGRLVPEPSRGECVVWSIKRQPEAITGKFVGREGVGYWIHGKIATLDYTPSEFRQTLD